MKILIIPDVHARPFWKDAVDKYMDEVDRVVFLGDYLDPYQSEGFTRKDAIRTLEEVIELKRNNKDKIVLLIGNHDAHYFLKHFARSSRYDSSHAYRIKLIFDEHKSLFQLAHEEVVNGKKYLFTHAGLMGSWVKRNKDAIGEPTVENLNRLIDSPKGIAALSDVSKYRTWFGEETGSILWSDLAEKVDDFDAETLKFTVEKDSIVKGYDYQIFGHTMLSKMPVITDNWACIDFKTAFILDDNNLLSIEEYEKEQTNKEQ